MVDDKNFIDLRNKVNDFDAKFEKLDYFIRKLESLEKVIDELEIKTDSMSNKIVSGRVVVYGDKKS